MHYIMSTLTHWLQNIHDLDAPLSDTNLYWKDFYPFALWHIWLHRTNSHVLTELEALHTRLELVLDNHITSLEVEIDSIEVAIEEVGESSEVNNVTRILEATPAGAKPILQADKSGAATTRSISLSTCTKLAMLGNLNIIPSVVTSSDAITTITAGDANSISATATVMS
ncbi:hypothetical protein KY285_030566 [Solanum tuberosum]|nr:hypothetical protein KY285_030566 [Solanum tuberosum]